MFITYSYIRYSIQDSISIGVEGKKLGMSKRKNCPPLVTKI